MHGFVPTSDMSGYAVIPPSGTFRELLKELDFQGADYKPSPLGGNVFSIFLN